MFKEGDNPQPGTPAAKVHAFTWGYRLANGEVTPCTVQGQAAEFVFGDTVDPTKEKFAVALLSKTHSGGIGVPCLAGGAVAQGAEVIVGMVEFTNNDGVTLDLPVAITATDGEDGDWIIGKATMGTYASEADTNVNMPSLAIETYGTPVKLVGGAQAPSVITLHVNLPTITAGDIVIDWTPGFAGEIVSIAAKVTQPVTTAAKAATLNAEINATNVTGGVLALTSANMTPTGAVVAATAITASNLFDANDTVSFEGSAVTAFVEGEIDLLITIKSTVGA